MKTPLPGEQCPCCPTEVRNLYAVAHNFALRLRGKSMSSDTTIEDLEQAVKSLEPFVDAHFADERHSHPPTGIPR